MNPQGLLLIYDFTEGILMQVRSWLLKKMVSLFEPSGPFFPCCAALEKRFSIWRRTLESRPQIICTNVGSHLLTLNCLLLYIEFNRDCVKYRSPFK